MVALRFINGLFNEVLTLVVQDQGFFYRFLHFPYLSTISLPVSVDRYDSKQDRQASSREFFIVSILIGFLAVEPCLV
jgi:hypothetical protein